jgi:hypothetical protein
VGCVPLSLPGPHQDADALATFTFLAGLHPLGRMGEVQEVAEAVLYLESAAFVTGENLHVDGGCTPGTRNALEGREIIMAKKRPSTIEACKLRSNRVLRLNHVKLIDEDIEWLIATERLTLWNVKVPVGLLAPLENLWWLDIRGGSGTDLAIAKGAEKLQYLAVNQVRGMCDLSVISEMTAVRYLDLYGLPNVTELPLCSGLAKLEHARLGQMRGLVSLDGLLQAPHLRELELVRKVIINGTDVSDIINHPAIEGFSWFAEDVPVKVWLPVVKKVGLPAVRHLHPEEWFGLAEFSSASNRH